MHPIGARDSSHPYTHCCDFEITYPYGIFVTFIACVQLPKKIYLLKGREKRVYVTKHWEEQEMTLVRAKSRLLISPFLVNRRA